MNTEKIEIDKIDQYLGAKKYIFIFGIGFDQRCLNVSNYIHENHVIKSIGILNYTWKHKAENNKNVLINLFKEKLILIDEENEKIIDVADSFIEKIKLTSEEYKNHEYLIDISAFSHELLAVILGILNSLKLIHKTSLIYTCAEEYGEWLSRGIVDIRSILGFPGTMLPSQKLHLIVMSGFEIERATEVIKWYEPVAISIGRGEKNQSISSSHFNSNKASHDKIYCFAQEFNSIDIHYDEFEFSCIDPFKTKTQILEYTQKLKDCNIVICPLNNKISTVGAVLAAIENDNIQLCYSQPAEYNIENYVEPSKYVRFIKLSCETKEM